MLNKLTGLFYGWRMVAASAAVRLLGAGLHSYGFTVFFLPLSQELNLSRTATSFAFSLARAEGAIEGPIVGHLLHRFGPRPVMLVAVSLMGIGYLLLSQATTYIVFLIVYTGLISLAHAGGFMHAPMTLTNTWFIRLRARAMTINSAAYGLGGVLLAPVLSVIVHSWGWRWGAAAAGMVFLLIGIPLCLTIRNSPESMGLLPDGGTTVGSSADPSPSRRPVIAEAEVTAAQAIRSFAFWALVFGAGVRNASYHAISTHFIPMMVWKGASQQEATLLLSAFAFLGFTSTLLFGWLADSMNKPRLVSFILFTAGASIFFLIFGRSVPSLAIFILLFTTVEATYPVAWAMVGDIFGRKHFPKIRGYMSMFYVWGSVLGPVIAGAVWDHWGSYEPMLWALIGMFFLSGTFYSLLGKPWGRPRAG
ncbi:MAG TPA: MFS transporter [Candidatus Binatia bacterium]|nr:MFS transporter [Candidatus Binatia bacterium]